MTRPTALARLVAGGLSIAILDLLLFDDWFGRLGERRN
jgi:hypothetical protein